MQGDDADPDARGQRAGRDIKQFNLEEFKDGWKRYGIEFTPTLIYYKEGTEVERLVGEQTKEALQSFISKHKS